MTAKVLSTVALLGFTNASSADEWKDNDVGRVIAGMLDDPDLFEFSQCCKSFNLLARGLLAWKIKGADYKPGDVWPGKFIRCSTVDEWHQQASDIGVSADRAMLKWDKKLSFPHCTFIRGIPDDADPVYTGQFITTQSVRTIPCLSPLHSSSHPWLAHWKPDLNSVAQYTGGNTAIKEIPLSQKVDCIHGSDLAFRIKHGLSSKELTLFHFSEESGIGPVISTLKLPRCTYIAIRDTQNNKIKGSTPEIISVAHHIESLPYLKYLVTKMDVDEKPQEYTVDLTRYISLSDYIAPSLSLDGTYIALKSLHKGIIAIVNTHTASVSSVIHIPGFEGDHCCRRLVMSDRYGLIDQRTTEDRRFQAFFDLKTGEIIGSSFNDGFNSNQWFNSYMLQFHENNYRQRYARSVYQPRQKLFSENVLIGLAKDTAVVERRHGTENLLLVGYWEKKNICSNDEQKDESDQIEPAKKKRKLTVNEQ